MSDQGRQYKAISSKNSVPYYILRNQGRNLNTLKVMEQVERFNKTLANMLSAYVQDYQTNLDDSLPYVMQAYWSAVHDTTGYILNFLMLGRETTTTQTLM